MNSKPAGVEPRSYTVNLTRGAYVIGHDCYWRLIAAIETKAPHVMVEADVLGDGLYTQPVRLVTSHVIAIVENERSSSERAVLRAVK